MFTAKVIGNVVATIKDERVLGAKFLIIQPVNSDLVDIGKPIVAVDGVGAGEHEYVFYATSTEGATVFGKGNGPIDAGICGIIDSVNK